MPTLLAERYRFAMRQLLERIRAGLQAGSYPSERSVSTSIVVPILRDLDWDDTDPSIMRPEYGTGNGRVDYALFPRVGAPAVFVEVKGVGRSGDADRQIFEYAFHEGAQIAVLTDGRIWNFYLPGEHGSYEDRRAYQLDLLERSLEQIEERLRRYLERARVVSGQALTDARADYRDHASRRRAQEILPQAWHDLLSEPDPELLNLLRERAEAMCGHRPTEEALEDWLRKQAAGLGVAAHPVPNGPTIRRRDKHAVAPATGTQAVSVTRAAPEAPPQTLAAERHTWRVMDKGGNGRDQVTAWTAFLSALWTIFPDRRDQMAAAVRTRSRNNIASTLEDVYPARPEIAFRSHVELPGGWFVGTNESSGTKLRIARKAAEAAGLVWGRDADLSLGN